MGPENLVLEPLKAIRAGIDGLRTDVQANGSRLDRVEGHVEVLAGEVTKIQLHLEWLRAQVGAASTQASMADSGRTRLEARLDDVVRRLEALEGQR